MKISKIVNLTPHALNFITVTETGTSEHNGRPVSYAKEYDTLLTIESEGVARAAQKRDSLPSVVIGDLELPCNRSSFGEPEGDLPSEPQDGTIYIVSQITAQAFKGQGRTEDIFIVDGLQRNAMGVPVGCTGLAKV